MWIRLTMLLILLAISDKAFANQQAMINAQCSRIQTECRSECVSRELIAQTQVVTANGQPPSCSAKNQRIAICNNRCYTEYIRCRGGK